LAAVAEITSLGSVNITLQSVVRWPWEALKLGLRYCCAIAVAFAVSALIMFTASGMLVGIVPFLIDSDPERHLVVFVIAYAAALVGVFLGSLCLIGRSPRLAAVTLLILGLGYYCAWCDRFKVEGELSQVAKLPLLLPLGLGGSSGVVFVAGFTAYLDSIRKRSLKPSSPAGCIETP
jgi:hypothetical protein